MNQSLTRGLTAEEVQERVRAGQVNRSRQSHLADYLTILRRNLLTVFNLMVAPAAVALWMLPDPEGDNYKAAIAVSAMAIINSLIGLVQEFQAKWHLDKLAILVETRARVWRDGELREIPASEVVLGDHLQLSGGDAIVADGEVLQSSALEVDEALLTGESDPVRRQPGERLLSGSVCVAGEGVYRADKIGDEAYAQSTSQAARRYKLQDTPLTRTINWLIEILTVVTVSLAALYFLLFWFGKVDGSDLAKMVAATITSMVPQGLVLTATVAFALGAVAMSMRGAIVQRLNAVEAMAGIDVVCTDKTGTLTTNHLQLTQVQPLRAEVDEAEVRRRLQLFAWASLDQQNRTVQALRATFPEVPVEVLDRLPFKSQNRCSAVRLRDGQETRLLVLGAGETLAERLSDGSSWQAGMAELQKQGLRVLLLAEGSGEPARNASLEGAGTLPEVPLQALGVLALSDELRPEARQTIMDLAQQGIAIKIISGDNPDTVRATVGAITPELARGEVVTGPQFAAAADRPALIDSHAVFGRVAPDQKVDIVEALQARGRRVAMIGDGVNDVLSIKRADLGVAMGEGTQASKTVAGLVLENNSFALLPETLEEGRTIVRNLRRSGKLFLVKNVYSLILILTFATGLISFPYVPQQVTLLNWLVIGIPAFVIALTRERSRSAVKTNFLYEVGWFAIRTGIIFGLAGVATLLLSRRLWHDPEETQRTLLLSVLILLGITNLFRALSDGEPEALKGDTRVRWLGVLAIPAYLLMMYWPLTADFFELVPLGLTEWWQVLVIVLPTWALSVFSDRWGMKRQG